MKLQIATLASAMASALVFAAAAQAAPATRVTVGQSPAEACAWATRQAPDNVPDAVRRGAIAACDEALDNPLRDADRTATLVNRGLLETASGQTDAALADFNAALARAPQMDVAYLNRGAALLRAARYDEARADFTRVIAMNSPNAAVAYFNRGIANEKAGDLPAAYRDYRQAQRLNPAYQAVKVELARFHAASPRYAENQ